MQWAHSISSQDYRLVAGFAGAGGEESHHPVEALVKHGLPTQRSTFGRILRICLSELRQASADEYLSAFGMKPTSSELHPVYALRRERSTLMIPALALLRGAFYPNQLLLSEMFLPQALDRLAIADPHAATLVKVLAHWPKKTCAHTSSPLRTLQWLLNDPMARQMASSVHAHAMNARIDMTLPPMEVEVIAHGIRRGTTVFVTGTRFRGAVLSRESFYGAGQMHHLFRSTGSLIAEDGSKSPARILRTPDGELHLSQQEWESVRARLHLPTRGADMQREFKDIFEGILIKLTGIVPTWDALQSLGKCPARHKNYYRRWSNCGDFAAMVEELNRIRSL
jgi:hypothetical protein